MSIDERTRHAIHGRFEELLGAELAGAFMSFFPPGGWGDVATGRDIDALAATTKDDIGALATTTKRDLSELAATTKRDLSELAATTKRDLSELAATMKRDLKAHAATTKNDLSALATTTKHDLDTLRSEIQLDMARELGSVRSEMGTLESRMVDRMDRHFRTTIFAMLGSNVTLVGLAFAAARLG